MENTEQTGDGEDAGDAELTLVERIRPRLVRARQIVGQVSLNVLYATAIAIQVWGDAERPCTRCRRKFPRRELHPRQITSTDYYRLFCKECCATLRAEREREVFETREYQVLQRQLKRAMLNGRAATLTLPVWIETLDYYNRRCAYCETGPYDVLEHLIPLTQGGGTTADNCVPACRSCNAQKRDHHPDVIVARAQAVARVKDDLRQRALPPPTV
jgi:5-methylcytosine-specific restriction endonuclease McrA